MRCIHIKNTDPYFCLAAEEYLLKNFDDDIFMLWQSEDTVVVGKHQNALGEINYPFVRENNIKIARRISGGGTVFHDAGNVNFSFIKNVKSPSEISFKQFTAPVVEALAKLGISATTSGRNDLMINGLKISGNAEHVYKNRVLHHGTLLFNSDLNNLGQAIKVTPGKYTSKAVQSKRSPVVNISQFLKTKIPVGQFIRFLLDVQLEKNGNTIYELNETDIQTIDKLSTEKFQTWEWNFGYSPKYSFKNEVEIGGKILQIEMVVQKGMIEECAISGGCFTEIETEKISSGLLNKRHYFEEINRVIKNFQVESLDEMVLASF
ncbi:lipoate--protein ligase [Draconibacterium sp.]